MPGFVRFTNVRSSCNSPTQAVHILERLVHQLLVHQHFASIGWLTCAPSWTRAWPLETLAGDAFQSCLDSGPLVLHLTVGLYTGAVLPLLVTSFLEGASRAAFLRSRETGTRCFVAARSQLQGSWPTALVLTVLFFASTGQVVVMCVELWGWLMQGRGGGLGA